MAAQSSYDRTSLPTYSTSRHATTKHLINRFFLQLYQGCGVSTCTTPHCATARSNRVSPPLRSYTPASARAMAVVLASAEDAHRYICPNLSDRAHEAASAIQERLDPKSILQQLFNSDAFRNLRSLEDKSSPDNSSQSPSIDLLSHSSTTCNDLIILCDAIRIAYPMISVFEHNAPHLGSAYSRLSSIFSDFVSLGRSFSDNPMSILEDSKMHSHTVRSIRLNHALRSVHMTTKDSSALIFNSMWEALEPLFESPFASTYASKTCPPADRNSLIPKVVYHAIHALSSFVPRASKETWHIVWSSIVHGKAYGKQRHIHDDPLLSPWLQILDAFEHDSALRMAKRLIRSIGAQTCLEETLTACGVDDGSNEKSDHRIRAWKNARRIRQTIIESLVQEEQSVRLAQFKCRCRDSLRHGGELTGTTSLIWLEWLRKCFLKEWDGSLRINRWSVAGSALELIEDLWKYRTRWHLDIPEPLFKIFAVFASLDVDKAAQDWMSFKPDPNLRHLLSFKFLFTTKAVTLMVRTSHHITMRRAYNEADATWHLRRRMMPDIDLQDVVYLDRRLRAAQDHYIVLKVNRQSILSDAFDQLWHRERRELLRPLRVRMGVDEGEIGHDLGGVQIEFFKLICQEAFKPGYSLFATDPQTHLAWFQSATLVPLYQYQLFGILFALAVYNGITLPVSFPLVFYKKLLFQTYGDIDLFEGWPSLAKSLQQLRNHQGSVEEDFAREYAYSFTANGLHLDVSMDDPWDGWTIWDRIKSRKNMGLGKLKVLRQSRDKHHPEFLPQQEKTEHTDAKSAQDVPLDNDTILSHHGEEGVSTATREPDKDELRWPGWKVEFADADEEPEPVTNENRQAYIVGYANWVIDWSIRPQFNAFARGFYSVMNLRTLALLTPEQFRTLVEGHNHLDIEALQRATTYNHYTANSPVVCWFWEVVKAYPQEKQKQLLEFVTASSRVPVNGAESLTFVIERSDSDTNALPGSSTCFGTLRLPEYESKEILESKLDIALEHSLGFGQA